MRDDKNKHMSAISEKSVYVSTVILKKKCLIYLNLREQPLYVNDNDTVSFVIVINHESEFIFVYVWVYVCGFRCDDSACLGGRMYLMRHRRKKII